MTPRSPFSDEDQKRMRSMDLRDAMVRTMLSGFLSAHFIKAGIPLSVYMVHDAIDSYVEMLPTVFDDAMKRFEAGDEPSVDLMKPRK